jgi:hypothetical protein
LVHPSIFDSRVRRALFNPFFAAFYDWWIPKRH